MSETLRRTWAEIDLSAIQHNYRLVRDRLSAGCCCMAVVKANAYGHGAVPVAKALSASGADWFGVATLDEAIELREHGITEPILILGYTSPQEAAKLATYRITQAVIDREHAEQLEREAAAADVTLDVHIKIDSGMTRVGFFCQTEALPIDEIAQSCSLPHLRAEGIFTHFAVADESDGEAVTRTQFTRFQQVIEALAARGITFALRHCCNSAAALRFPDMHLDMVRAGIVLYGVPPSGDPAEQAILRPTMALKTTVSLVKEVPADIGVSYGHTARTAAPTTLATLPIGYADGLLRLAAAKHRVSVGGTTAPLVGRVCMDQCVIDVTDIADATQGLPVTVFGDALVSVSDYAAACQTIPYESFCLVSKRVPRLYRGND